MKRLCGLLKVLGDSLTRSFKTVKSFIWRDEKSNRFGPQVLISLSSYCIVFACVLLFNKTNNGNESNTFSQTLVEGFFPTTITLVLSMIADVALSNERNLKIILVSVSCLVLYIVLAIYCNINMKIGGFIAIIVSTVLVNVIELKIIYDLESKNDNAIA